MTAITSIGQFISTGVTKQRQRRSVERAVRQALAQFRGTHPEWANAFFDTHFLLDSSNAVAQQIAAGQLPRAAQLARAWADQLTWHHPNKRDRAVAQMTPVAADFLRTLRAELG